MTGFAYGGQLQAMLDFVEGRTTATAFKAAFFKSRQEELKQRDVPAAIDDIFDAVDDVAEPFTGDPELREPGEPTEQDVLVVARQQLQRLRALGILDGENPNTTQQRP